jgi:hypothetical protein
MRLRVDPEAEDEIREAAVWYEHRHRGLGVEFLAAVDNALQQIRKTPDRGLRCI